MTKPRCVSHVSCPADVHRRDCPWHPDNQTVQKISAADMERLLAELDAPAKELPRLRKSLQAEDPFTDEKTRPLSAGELEDVEKLVALQHAGVSLMARSLALALKYSYPRWTRVLAEVARRTGVGR